jgi:pantoate--beta-alanine ligase
VLEGVHRGRSHFDGVTTVVTKLLNIVMPDVAYFGRKDAQQALAIRRLVCDLDMPVRIEVCPTVRDRDGLALSSRNARLTPAERARARSLHRALRRIREALESGERDPLAARRVGLAELSAAGVEPEYLELVGTTTLAPVARIDGQILAVVAARIGPTRLIDNELIEVPSVTTKGPNNPVATALAAPTR